MVIFFKCAYNILFLFKFFYNLLNIMGFFTKKTEKEKLQDQYRKLLAEAHRLSTSNRKLSDEKVAEAEAVMQKIEALT